MVRVQAGLWRTRSASAAGSAVIGGSMGGMQALEWGVMFPDRVRVDHPGLRLHRRPRAQQIAWTAHRAHGHPPRSELARRRLLRRRPGRRPPRRPGRRPPDRPGHLPLRRGVHRPLRPLAGRRRTSDRSTGQRFEVERYLDYHGDKLVRRFDANSLPAAGQGDGPPRRRPGRGGSRTAALARIKVPVAVDRRLDRHAVPVVPAAPAWPTDARRRRAPPPTSRSIRPTATTAS